MVFKKSDCSLFFFAFSAIDIIFNACYIICNTMKPTSSEDVGPLLKAERQKRNLSLRALARLAGVSAAIVLRIEQGTTSPSFATLKKILDAFNMSFAEFFNAGKKFAESPVIHKSEMKKMIGIGEKLSVTIVNAGTSDDLQLIYEEYAAGGHTGRDMLRHDSVEAGICLKGKLLLELAGKTYPLSAGDGWFFDSKIPHRFSNPAKTKAVLISANTPATF